MGQFMTDGEKLFGRMRMKDSACPCLGSNKPVEAFQQLNSWFNDFLGLLFELRGRGHK